MLRVYRKKNGCEVVSLTAVIIEYAAVSQQPVLVLSLLALTPTVKANKKHGNDTSDQSHAKYNVHRHFRHRFICAPTPR